MKKILLIIVGGALVLGVLLVGWFLIQTARTNAQIEQEWQTTRVEKMQNLGTPDSLEILPVFQEAKASDAVELEHGVS